MATFLVQRQPSDGIATMGELLVNGERYCSTLEPADPIPAGTFDLSIYWSDKFNRLMPHVDGVPGHSGIEIHWGNIPINTDGCTLLGEYADGDFVGNSVDEFNEFFSMLSDIIQNEGAQFITYAEAGPFPSTTDGGGAENQEETQ